MQTFEFLNQQVGLDWRVMTFEELREVLDDDSVRIPGHVVTKANVLEFLKILEDDGLIEVGCVMRGDIIEGTQEDILHFEVRLVKDALVQLEKNLPPYGPCLCGSGKKYRFCCYNRP